MHTLFHLFHNNNNNNNNKKKNADDNDNDNNNNRLMGTFISLSSNDFFIF